MRQNVFRKTLSVLLSAVMVFTLFGASLTALAAISGVPTRTDVDSYFSDPTLYGAEKWDKTTGLSTLTFNWDAYSGSIGYDPQPGKLTFTYPSHVYLNVGETLEGAGYMGHMTASYGENDGSDVTDFRVLLSSATWGESTRAGFGDVIGSLIAGYSHQGTCTEGSKQMTGSSSHYDFSNDGRGSDQIIGDKSGDNENFLADNESVVVWRSNIQWTGSDMNNFDEYVLLKGTASKTGEVTFNPTENFTIGAAQRFTGQPFGAWHSDNGTRFNRWTMNGGSRPQTTPAEDALSITFTVYDKSELNTLINAADNGNYTLQEGQTQEQFNAALAAAKAVRANREVTQDEIDAVAAAIGDKMTLLVNAHIDDYNAAESVSMDDAVFNKTVYHYAQEATEGYNSVVYAPAASTVNGEATSYIQFKYDNCYYRVYMPVNTVLVYTGQDEDNEPRSPIMMGHVGDGSNNSRAIYYLANATSGTHLPLQNFWVGYKDGSSNNRDYLTDLDKVWANAGSNEVHFNGTVVDSGFMMTDNQGNKNTWRNYWNYFRYTGTGDTDIFYEKFDSSNINLSLRHYWKAMFSDDDTYNSNDHDDMKLPGAVYVINYKPVYDKLNDAAAVKAILEGDDAWMYTEASVKRAKATIAAMLKADPNDYAYEGDVNNQVVACADAIKDAAYMLDHDGLTLEKKQGTVTFVSQTGETLAINGQPATYTKDYGETVAANEIPQLSNVYYRADNAQWDYSEDLSWDLELPETIVFDEPEKVFTISDDQTVQTYTVNFYDEDGTTFLVSAPWQYGDYPDYGGTAVKANGNDSTGLTLPTKQDYDFNYEISGWKDGENNAFDGLNATLNQFVAEGDNYNSTTYLTGDKFTKYVAVYTATAREDADYTAYNEALAAANAVLAIPGLDSAKAAEIQGLIDAEIARAHDADNRNFRSDDVDGVDAIAEAVTNLNAIVAAYTDGEGNLNDENKATFTVTWVVNDVTVETDEGVLYGALPAYDGATPTRADAQYTYAFTGWDGDINAPVTADATFTALFDEDHPTTNNYTVKFVYVPEGTETVTTSDEQTLAYGSAVIFPAAAASYRDGADVKTFVKWTDGEGNEVDPTTATVSGDATYTAVYDTEAGAARYNRKVIARLGDTGVRITLIEWNDMVYNPGTMISVVTSDPADIRYEAQVWTFDSWEGDYHTGLTVPCTGDDEFVAVFKLTDEVAKYTVEFKNDNGSRIAKAEYEYNAPVETPATPASGSRTIDTDYTFTGWTPAVADTVTADAVYTATYETEGHARVYPVAWKYEENTATGGVTEMAYGHVITAADLPEAIVVEGDSGHTVYNWENYLGKTFDHEDVGVPYNYDDSTDAPLSLTDYGTTEYHTANQDYITIGYTWTGSDADGYTACAAAMTCSVCDKVVLTETSAGDNFQVITHEADKCTETTTVTYKAMFNGSNFDTQWKRDIDTGVAGPHRFVWTTEKPTRFDWEYSDLNNVTCTASQECVWCTETREEEGTVSVYDRTEADCAHPEITVFKAEFASYSDQYSDEIETAPVAPNAHEYAQINEATTVRPVYDEATGEWSKGTLHIGCDNTFSWETGSFDASHDRIIENVDRADYTAFDAAYEKFISIGELDIDGDTVVTLEDPYAGPQEIPFSDIRAYVANVLNTSDAFPKNLTTTHGGEFDEQPRVDYMTEQLSSVVGMIFNEDGTVKDGLLNTYTVTFTLRDGTVTTYADKFRGDVVDVPAAPATADGYNFEGWALEGSTAIDLSKDAATYTVAGNAAFTAAYSDAPISYVITWVVDGAESTTTVEHGQTPVFTGSTDKADDDLYAYAFTGWEPVVVAAEDVATYTAQYSKVYNDAVQDKIDEAQDLIDNHADEYEGGFIDDLRDALDTLDDNTRTDDEKKAALDDLKDLIDSKDDSKLVPVDTAALTDAIAAANTVVNDPASAALYTPEALAGLADAIAAAQQYLDDTAGTSVPADELAAKQQEIADKTAALNDAVNGLEKNPADYTEYNALRDKLEALKDNDALTDELKAAVNERYHNPLPDDLKIDQQQTVDDEVAALKAVLDQILEKDGDDYTDTVKDSALAHFTVTFKWKTSDGEQTAAQTVAKHAAAAAPEVPACYHTDNAASHYLFSKWDKAFADVTADLTVNAKYTAEAHSGTWTVVTAPTEEAEGLAAMTCSVCEAPFTKAIPPFNENSSQYRGVVTKPATCQEEGVKTYTWVGSDEVTFTRPIPKTEHQWGAWVVTIPATDESDGVAERTCAVCGETETDTAINVSEGTVTEVKFNNIGKMHYVIDLGNGETYTVYNSSTVMWNSNRAMKFTVCTYATFNYPDYIVYVDGQALTPDADGVYTIPASGGRVVVSVAGAVKDDSAPSGKLSFWELLIRFFQKIVAFFTSAFGKNAG